MDIREFLGIHVWICYGFSDQGIVPSHRYLNYCSFETSTLKEPGCPRTLNRVVLVPRLATVFTLRSRSPEHRTKRGSKRRPDRYSSEVDPVEHSLVHRTRTVEWATSSSNMFQDTRRDCNLKQFQTRHSYAI